TRADPVALLDWLAETGITVAFVPTPLAEALLAEPWPKRARLRLLLTGGDRLRRFANPAHPYRLVNHYGPTESTVVATAGEVGRERPGRLPTIGAPIDNTVCYVVAPDGQLLGPGCPGELWIGGAGIARGYRGDAALEAERFLRNPFADSPPRVYRTGDLVRWEEDGTLAFLGRIDDQLKIRGHRIEPREVEALLAEHPGIAQALVTARGSPGGDSVLAAYVVPAGAEPLAAADIRRWLRDRLPPPMVPAAVVPLARIPVTAHGKVDVDALPEPVVERAAAPRGPSNPTEEALCRLWADVLGAPDVGVDDDFFDLGGHSLLATQLVARVREAFRVELPL